MYLNFTIFTNVLSRHGHRPTAITITTILDKFLQSIFHPKIYRRTLRRTKTISRNGWQDLVKYHLRDSSWETTSIVHSRQYGQIQIQIQVYNTERSLTCRMAMDRPSDNTARPPSAHTVTHGRCYDIARPRVNNAIKISRRSYLFWHCYVYIFIVFESLFKWKYQFQWGGWLWLLLAVLIRDS